MKVNLKGNLSLVTMALTKNIKFSLSQFNLIVNFHIRINESSKKNLVMEVVQL